MQLQLGIAALAMVAAGVGAAQAEQRSYDLAPFDTVHVTTGISAVISVGTAQSVSADAPNVAALDRLQVVVHEGTLELSLGDNLVGRLLTLGQQPPILVHVALPSLKAADANAGANLDIENMKGETLALSASSGAAVVAKLVGVHSVSLDVSSGADLKIDGACTHLIANVASGGNLDARNLACDEVNASASSGGHGSVDATSSINAHASLGGGLEVVGKPTSVTSDSNWAARSRSASKHRRISEQR